mmetsp:Transcript_6619/g.19164  ORF Transcript_6619/g.19164 Transcript_6619/m.19164 type:complete len:430 (+) Transcript_6619:2775-4064(+)
MRRESGGGAPLAEPTSTSGNLDHSAGSPRPYAGAATEMPLSESVTRPADTATGPAPSLAKVRLGAEMATAARETRISPSRRVGEVRVRVSSPRGTERARSDALSRAEMSISTPSRAEIDASPPACTSRRAGATPLSSRTARCSRGRAPSKPSSAAVSSGKRRAASAPTCSPRRPMPCSKAKLLASWPLTVSGQEGGAGGAPTDQEGLAYEAPEAEAGGGAAGSAEGGASWRQSASMVPSRYAVSRVPPPPPPPPASSENAASIAAASASVALSGASLELDATASTAARAAARAAGSTRLVRLPSSCPVRMPPSPPPAARPPKLSSSCCASCSSTSPSPLRSATLELPPPRVRLAAAARPASCCVTSAGRLRFPAPPGGNAPLHRSSPRATAARNRRPPPGRVSPSSSAETLSRRESGRARAPTRTLLSC